MSENTSNHDFLSAPAAEDIQLARQHALLPGCLRTLVRRGLVSIFLSGFSIIGFSQALAASTAAPAAIGQVVTAVLTQNKIVKASDGSEKREDAGKVKPGDVIEYKVTYTNTGGAAVNNVVAHLPVPDGLEYLPKSAKPAAGIFQAATSNGIFAPEPLMKSAGGITSPAPYSDYRQLRWNLGILPAHGVAAVTARVRVETVIPDLPALTVPAPLAAVEPEKLNSNKH